MGLVEQTSSALDELGVDSTSRLLIGVSGGPDSVALAHVLIELKKQSVFEELVVAHVDHSLRDSSKVDAKLVANYATDWRVPFESTIVDTKAIAKHQTRGIEETARDIRYQFFSDVAEQHKVTHVVTAHTANDQAETIIMHAVRGAGVRGLAGIPAKRKLGDLVIIRPWLGVLRSEIEAYIDEQKLEVARDESNSDQTFQRNRIRHAVIPAIEAAYPGREPVKALASLARRMADVQKFLSVLTAEKLETVLLPSGGIPINALKNLHGFPLHALVEAWIAKSGGHYRLTETETKKIEKFLHSTARKVELRHGLVIERKKDRDIGDVLSLVFL